MKNLLRILLVFLVSSINALGCGWYPYGEEIRFSMMNPEVFDDGGMSPYYFVAWQYGDEYEATAKNDPNVELWKKYCDGKVDAKAIFQAVYSLTESAVLNENPKNNLLVYLRKNNPDAIQYLAFAKSCSGYNEVDSYWYRYEYKLERSKKMLEALKRSRGSKDEELIRRYRFLAIRLAYYNNDYPKVKAIYEKSFTSDWKDALDYWALYFKTMSDDFSAQKNFELAQIFVHAPGKRFGALGGFEQSIPIEEVLRSAKTNAERANVYVMYSVRDKGRSLSTLKKVNELDPTNPLMNFLVVREVNKLEDWVLTPRYTEFPPTVDLRGSFYETKVFNLMEERTSDDKKYASELANWLATAKQGTNSGVMKLAEAYLHGVGGNPSKSLSILNGKTVFTEDASKLVAQFKVLFKVQVNAAAALSSAEKEVLMASTVDKYNYFLFAVSREYEFQKKMDIAAALFSHVNDDLVSYEDEISWRSKTKKETLGMDYYYSWFLYLDAEYAPDEVQKVIDFAQMHYDENSEFERWQRVFLIDDFDRLHDLLGTKYIRQNKIDEAIIAFEKVKVILWENDPYKTYLDANPFHADFYSEHQASEYDTVQYTKLEIASLYRDYLKKAENPNTKNRAYYYFLVANCQLNMSQYGNSWMMRRYFWSSYASASNLDDDDDYFRVKRAKVFYEKAMEVSKDAEIKALCLRMVGRCEHHQLNFDAPNGWDFDYDRYGGYSTYMSGKNQSFKQLKTKYPDLADELLSNCWSFQRYFTKLQEKSS
mgnify:CR=1 FL=1